MEGHIHEEPTTETTETKPKTVTIKLPRINGQTLVLALVAVVTVLQAFQLYGLKTSVKGSAIKPAAAAAASVTPSSNSGSSGGSNSSLPEMVGGC